MALGPKAVFQNFLSPYAEIHSYQCAPNLAISKGTILELCNDVLASKAQAWTLGSSSTSGVFIGLAFADKDATDGAEYVPVLKAGRADMRASGAITLGRPVYCAGNDEVRALPAGVASEAIQTGLLSTMMVGIAEETASDGEVITVRFVK